MFNEFNAITVGFDRLFRHLENTRDYKPIQYPPYDVIKLQDNVYCISIAVAGIPRENLTVELKENELTIEGKKADDAKGEYLYNGIAKRSFVRKFTLSETVKPIDVILENGVLQILLKEEIPERLKPQVIEIKTGDQLGYEQRKLLGKGNGPPQPMV